MLKNSTFLAILLLVFGIASETIVASEDKQTNNNDSIKINMYNNVEIVTSKEIEKTVIIENIIATATIGNKSFKLINGCIVDENNKAIEEEKLTETEQDCREAVHCAIKIENLKKHLKNNPSGLIPFRSTHIDLNELLKKEQNTQNQLNLKYSQKKNK